MIIELIVFEIKELVHKCTTLPKGLSIVSFYINPHTPVNHTFHFNLLPPQVILLIDLWQAVI